MLNYYIAYLIFYKSVNNVYFFKYCQPFFITGTQWSSYISVPISEESHIGLDKGKFIEVSNKEY